MAEYMWPSLLCPNASDLMILDSAGRFTSPMNGFTQTISRPGDRLRMSLQLRNLTGQKRALMRGFIAGMRGGTNRVWVPDHSAVLRGSYVATELNPNPTMEDGTTGYTAGTDYSLSVSDQVLRATRIANDAGTDRIVRLTNAVTVTPYQPYCGRVLVMPGRGPYTGFELDWGSTTFGSEYASTTGYSAGLMSLAFTPNASTAHFSLHQAAANGVLGDYVEIPYVSVAPCALVDNASNLLPYSDDFNNAAWTKTRATINNNTITFPDGSTGTTNVLAEDNSAANTHFVEDSVTVAAAAADYSFAVVVKLLQRTFVRLQMVESTSSHDVSVFVNLTTGASSNLTVSGANWTNQRVFVSDMGNGNYYIALLGRKASAGTTLTARITIGESAGDVTFTGITQNSLIIWRATLSQSSVPAGLSQTTGTALASGSLQNLGGGLHTKGWPASTNEIRKIGDVIEIGGQLVILTAPVNSDASGRAFIQYAPVTHTAPADNTPIILCQPMGKFLLDPNENGWTNVPGVFSDAEIVLAQAA